jgi:hypothetical protein
VRADVRDRAQYVYRRGQHLHGFNLLPTTIKATNIYGDLEEVGQIVLAGAWGTTAGWSGFIISRRA